LAGGREAQGVEVIGARRDAVVDDAAIVADVDGPGTLTTGRDGGLGESRRAIRPACSRKSTSGDGSLLGIEVDVRAASTIFALGRRDVSPDR
jgi:hypothetical protein